MYHGCYIHLTTYVKLLRRRRGPARCSSDRCFFELYVLTYFRTRLICFLEEFPARPAPPGDTTTRRPRSWRRPGMGVLAPEIAAFEWIEQRMEGL